MRTTRKTITVTEQQDTWTKSQIAAGIDEIRAALIEGESSGEPEPFDPERFKREMMEKHGDGTV